MQEITQSILNKIYLDSCKSSISSILKTSEDLDNILFNIEEIVKYDNTQIHIYLIFLEYYIKKNKSINKKLFEYIKYIFYNYEELSNKNIFLNSFLNDIYYSDILFSKYFLEDFKTLEIEKIDINLRLRVINFFTRYFDDGILLKNYKDFFREILISIINNNENLLNKTDLDFKKLYNYFWFSVSQSVELLYYLYDKWVIKSYYYSIDANFLANIWEKIFIEEVNKLKINDYIRFFDEIERYLEFNNFKNKNLFKDEIKYYLSILTWVKYFDDVLDKDFINYYKMLISYDEKTIFKNIEDLKNANYLVKFLEKNKLNIFLDLEFFEYLLNAIFIKTDYYFDLVKIINFNLDYFLDNYLIFLKSFSAYKKSPNKENLFCETIYDFCSKVLKNYGIKSLINIIKLWILRDLEKNSWYRKSDLIESIFDSKWFKTLTYKELEIIYIFMLDFLDKYSVEKFVYLIINTWAKWKYIVWRNFKLLKNILWNDYYSLQNIQPKIFYNNIFPVNLVHYILYLKWF